MSQPVTTPRFCALVLQKSEIPKKFCPTFIGKFANSVVTRAEFSLISRNTAGYIEGLILCSLTSQSLPDIRGPVPHPRWPPISDILSAKRTHARAPNPAKARQSMPKRANLCQPLPKRATTNNPALLRDEPTKNQCFQFQNPSQQQLLIPYILTRLNASRISRIRSAFGWQMEGKCRVPSRLIHVPTGEFQI